MADKPDYSTWLTPDRLAIEERYWADPALRTWPLFVAAIAKIRERYPINWIIEFGCGTGWVPSQLPSPVRYAGVDSNARCLALAVEKFRGRDAPEVGFYNADIRTVEITPWSPDAPDVFDLACSFSVLKHFGLHEWDAVVAQILKHGRYGVFSMSVGSEVLDDGVEFPHVWVTQERLRQAVQAAGHDVLWLDPMPTGETMVFTQAR
jgi:SAM-dependent methyltransferase